MSMSNHSKRNALHLAAMYASTATMDILSAASVEGLDADARDRDGHTPNECFLKCRNAHCAVARQSLEVERKSWTALMKSARGQARILLDGGDLDHQKLEKFSEGTRSDHEDPSPVDEMSSDSLSDDDFVDAEDSCENVAWRHDVVKTS